MKTKTLLIILLFFVQFVFAKTITIKFATLAPEGSAWLKVMKDFNKHVQQATQGEVRFKIYPGGVQGDEKDVLRKIRINQLQGAGFTGVGLGEILPEVRILDAPFLFQNDAEVDYVARKFFDKFAADFEKKGYVLLGWAEVGFVYIYTNVPVKTIDDFSGIKMWMWEGDPLAQATFKAFGINPIPLSITDVLTSLQTGLIDGVYTSPLACLALQWFTKVKYMVSVPLANSNGAVLVSKRIFKKLSVPQQKVVREKGLFYFSKLTRLSRRENKASTQRMLSKGLKKIDFSSPEIMNKIQRIGKQARRNLIGKLYSRELLNETEQALADFRRQNENGADK